MRRVFITGSSDGLGKMVATILLQQNIEVVLHARNEARAGDAIRANPSAKEVLIGDLSSIEQTIQLADAVNRLGDFDAVIHNAAVGYQERRKIVTEDGLPHVFAVNSLAPYILTARINKPKRLIYLSSSLHLSGDSSLEDLTWEHKSWSGYQAYADSKLHNVILAFAMGNRWTDVHSNALEPGWVATKMGGAGAPDSLADAPLTQVWLATSEDQEALKSGGYYFHKKPKAVHGDAKRVEVQDKFLEQSAKISGVRMP